MKIERRLGENPRGNYIPKEKCLFLRKKMVA